MEKRGSKNGGSGREGKISPKSSMLLSVKVIANAKSNRVEKTGNNDFKVYTSQKPEDGKANESAVKLLAEFLGVPKKILLIKWGIKSRNKKIEMRERKNF